MKLSRKLRSLLENFPNDDIITTPSGKKWYREGIETLIERAVRAERNDDATVLMQIGVATGYEPPLTGD